MAALQGRQARLRREADDARPPSRRSGWSTRPSGAGWCSRVDHTFVYTGAVRKMRELVDQSGLGEIYYYDSVRVNLGLFQHDVNVIWDLAVHDLSIMDYVLPAQPVAVSATGVGHVAGRAGEHRLPDPVLRQQPDRAHPRQLAGAGQGAPDADRRQPQDDRLRRPRAEREDQGLRQGHHAQRTTAEQQRRERLPDARRLSHRRHVGAAARRDRGAARRGSPLRRLHRRATRRRSPTARPACASSGSSKRRPQSMRPARPPDRT